jgi:serine/threonine protein kinase
VTNATTKLRSQPEGTFEVGQVLDGKYRVDYLIGQGGMAAVWAGTNERTGKQVALKALLPALAGLPDLDALFRREVLAASRVNHPNVVTVFDVIEHQGMACIVMELLVGEPLDSYLARNSPLGVSDACGLLLPAMSGVAAAHAQGVIHRDLKPQNIFVCIGSDGRAVTTKVLDFGISMLVGLARDRETTWVESMPLGTPAYMAPEQIIGGAPIDERTDVYGFGVLFFETLAGRIPFPDEPLQALYQSVLFDPAPPLGQFRPDLPVGLVRTIETALAKAPCHRPASLDAMVTAIEAELLGTTPRVLTPVAGVSRVVGSAVPSECGVTGLEDVLPSQAASEHQPTRFRPTFPSRPIGHGGKEVERARTSSCARLPSPSPNP